MKVEEHHVVGAFIQAFKRMIIDWFAAPLKLQPTLQLQIGTFMS